MTKPALFIFALALAITSLQERDPGRGKRNHESPFQYSGRNESTVICFLPDWQFWTGRAPCVHRLFVRSLPAGGPFKQIAYQIFDGVLHDVVLAPLARYL